MSPACDMFEHLEDKCNFYPYIKLKGRFTKQVKKNLHVKRISKGGMLKVPNDNKIVEGD